MEIFDQLTPPSALWHPEYASYFSEWHKWRLAYYCGRQFINDYLKKYSSREDQKEFDERKCMTYVPAFAKAAVNKVKNLVASQLGNVIRKSSSSSYMKACDGLLGGVDNLGSSMNYFIGTNVLTELLVMGKVAVYVDMPPLDGIDLISTQNKRPYLYTFTREQITNWKVDPQGILTSIMLREYIFDFDEEYEMPTKLTMQYRHYYKDKFSGKVHYKLLDDSFKSKTDEMVLNISEIPVAILQLNNSLMEDIADYQIALMNIASADLAYTIKSNFPFYIEFYDMMAEATFQNIQQGYAETDEDGNSIGATEVIANTALDKEITVGATKGRRVPKGLEAPRFISPPPDALKISIEKQNQMKQEINDLLDLAVTNLTAMSADKLNRPPTGLNHIGLELESGERKIVRLWHNYENIKEEGYVVYPVDFTPRPMAERVAEANLITDVIPKIPSNTFKKEMAKKAIHSLLGGTVPLDVISKINSEIDQASAIVPDAKTIASDVEQGLVSAELGSELRGYPDGEAEKAQDEHAARLARIALAQGLNKAPVQPDAGARGVGDMAGNAGQEAKNEKTVSQNIQDSTDTKKKTRGEGK